MNHSTYTSPFSWRYGSKEMRTIFSEKHKYEVWRRIWVALAKAQHKAGLINDNELKNLEKNQNNIDIEKILAFEKDTKHDVMAAIKEYASHATVGGGKIHLGATSMDINDNADMLRMKEAMMRIKNKVISILELLSQKIEKYADTPCMAYTHLQPAEPTTVGYRFAFYAQDLLMNLELLNFVNQTVKGKGIKGAVGTAASYNALLDGSKTSVEELETKVMEGLGIKSVLIASQVYPRQFDYLIMTTLAAISSSLSKTAGDIRILQSPLFGEWSEPFGKKQVGSSAMPFKKNPINSEKICSLGRYISQLPPVVLENASLSYLERTLDDSANRRVILPDAFLATDEILNTFIKLMQGLIINEKRVAYNLTLFSPFSATESILMAAVKKGADRQKMHEVLKEISMQAWQDMQQGLNTMEQLLTENKLIHKYLTENEVKQLLDVRHHTGNASKRALQLVKQIKKQLIHEK